MADEYPKVNNGNDTSGLSKEEIQRELEAKRDKIANTVDEIRHTLSGEVQDRKEAMRKAVDWHTYVDKNPAACLAGATAVGFLVGKMIGGRFFQEHEDPTWRGKAERYYHDAERKLDEWRGRAQGESKWKARSRSAMTHGTELLMRQLMRTAQQMIVPAVIAAVTGKVASSDKTTVVEKEVRPGTGMGPDVEVTRNVREYKDGELKSDTSNPTI